LGCAAASIACGHTVDDPTASHGVGGDADSPPSTGAAGDAGPSSQAGSGAATGSGGAPVVVILDTPSQSGSAGAAPKPLPVPHAALPCENPRPLSSGGGYEQCDDYSLRRSKPEACVSVLPRDEPASGLLFDECERDTDCAAAANGYCVIGQCSYGCVVDEDCGEGQLCYCGELIGACQIAGCKSDADCPSDYPCTGNPRAADSVEFLCQTPLDECQTDRDCNRLDARMFCGSDGTRRLCLRNMVG
jgi:hypothetical protein